MSKFSISNSDAVCSIYILTPKIKISFYFLLNGFWYCLNGMVFFFFQFICSVCKIKFTLNPYNLCIYRDKCTVALDHNYQHVKRLYYLDYFITISLCRFLLKLCFYFITEFSLHCIVNMLNIY